MVLSRSWLFDNYVMHDGHAYNYAIKLKGHSLTLAPSLPPNLLKLNSRREVKSASMSENTGEES